MPAAWYWPQPQSENGESRSSWKPNVRSPKTRAAWSGSGSSSRMRKRRERRADERRARSASRAGSRQPFGYVSHSGASSSAANFVQPASATAAPRAQAEEASQKPQIRNAGMIVSFVFEFDA